MKMKAIVSSVLLGCVTPLVLAHPGHGPVGEHGHGLLHPFVGLEHVLAFAAIGMGAFLLRRCLIDPERDREE